MSRQQVRRGLVAVATTAVVSTLAPAAHAGSAPQASQERSQNSSAARQPIGLRLRIANRGPRAVTTSRGWAAGLLRDERVRVARADIVEVRRDGRRIAKPKNRRLRAGDAVHLIRVTTQTSATRAPIKPRTVERSTTDLKPGRRKVVARGRDGVRKIVVKRVRHNYEVVDSNRKVRVLRAPEPRRVLVGRAARSVPGANHLNWGGLANCESSGNPRAVNPAGYYGLYQFDIGTWRSVGGSGVPSSASPAEQTYRAKLLYKQRGRSPWPHCGRYL